MQLGTLCVGQDRRGAWLACDVADAGTAHLRAESSEKFLDVLLGSCPCQHLFCQRSRHSAAAALESIDFDELPFFNGCIEGGGGGKSADGREGASQISLPSVVVDGTHKIGRRLVLRQEVDGSRSTFQDSCKPFGDGLDRMWQDFIGWPRTFFCRSHRRRHRASRGACLRPKRNLSFPWLHSQKSRHEDSFMPKRLVSGDVHVFDFSLAWRKTS